jgi:hypothetical protein
MQLRLFCIPRYLGGPRQPIPQAGRRTVPLISGSKLFALHVVCEETWLHPKFSCSVFGSRVWDGEWMTRPKVASLLFFWNVSALAALVNAHVPGLFQQS